MPTKRLIKTRLEKPYKDDNKTTNFPLRNKPGVYMIYKNDVLRYIGFSGVDLYRTMYHHFQNWPDRNQYRATYSRENCKVRVIYTNNARQAVNLEIALIHKHNPKDNKNNNQSALNYFQKEILTEATEAPVSVIGEYKEAWE